MSHGRGRRTERIAGAGLALLAALLLTAATKSDDRIQLFPNLHNGDTLRYESHARLNRYVKTKSNVVTMYEPQPLLADFSAHLLLSVHDFHALDRRPMMAADTQFVSPDWKLNATATPAQSLKVDFSVGGDGSVTRADGLDNLGPVERLAWQFWVSQFAFAWTLPSAGVRPGEKWKSVEVEQTPSPIANLVWERETTYDQDDTCPILRDEPCAVFLITAALKQKSNPDNATPEEYKLHELKTFGTAQGDNETYVYISRKTGLLLRASEDLKQSLDVTIAKADGTNQVHYLVEVTSHFETVYVPPASIQQAKTPASQ